MPCPDRTPPPVLRPVCNAAAALLLALLGAQAAPALAQPQAEPPAVLRFSDFFVMPIGPAGVAFTPRLRAADGQRVRITGYMVAQESAPPGRFFLTPRPLTMSEHADGEADDLPPTALVVLLPPAERGLTPLHTRGLLQLTGTLHVGRQELDDGRVSWVRLALDPRPATDLSTPPAGTAP